MDAPMVNVFVGSETGILKDVKLGDKTSWTNVNSIQEADRSKEIIQMCWTGPEQTQVAVGLRNQTVQVYDTGGKSVVKTYSLKGGEGAFKGLGRYQENFITCVESGLLQVWEGEESKLQIDCGKDIYRMKQDDKNPHIVATGGKENDLKIWDLNTPETPIFKAKNVRNDWLDLRVPVWVTDVAFLPGGQRVLTGTGHHQVRVYDIKSAQRRPVINIEFDEYPISTMSLTSNENQVVVGNTRGRVSLIDLRRADQAVRAYLGFPGAIRSIQCHPSLPLFAACGLDRFLHVHNIESKQKLHKIYLKSRLNCVLFADRLDTKGDENQETEDMIVDETADVGEEKSNDEDDDVWDNMEEVGVKSKSKKQKDSGERTQKVSFTETKKKGKKRKNVPLKNVFYEERTADQTDEKSTEAQQPKKKRRKKKSGKVSDE